MLVCMDVVVMGMNGNGTFVVPSIAFLIVALFETVPACVVSSHMTSFCMLM